MPLTSAAGMRVATGVRTARAGAWFVLAGTLITLFGLGWDIQWHVEVGPDTFFTLSHLALYSGSAIAGIAGLTMVLLSTSAQRAGRAFPRYAGGPPIRVLGGTFHAPLGYLICGSGAALFLLYGLLDLWWHSIYGFDAVLNTPSHVALFLAVSITMAGSIVVCAAARDQRWGRIGLLLSIPIMIVFGPIAFNGLSQVPLPIDPVLLGIILCAPTLLIMSAALLGRWAAIQIAVVLGVLQGILWWFSPWAAEAYAGVVGLPLRDVISAEPPVLPSTIPMFLIVAALTTEGFFALGRSGRLRPAWLMVLAGAAAGFVVGGGLALQTILTDPTQHLSGKDIGSLMLLGLILGPLTGYLGCRFAVMLRTETAAAPAVDPAGREFGETAAAAAADPAGPEIEETAAAPAAAATGREFGETAAAPAVREEAGTASDAVPASGSTRAGAGPEPADADTVEENA
jgi:hypothetical protein